MEPTPIGVGCDTSGFLFPPRSKVNLQHGRRSAFRIEKNALPWRRRMSLDSGFVKRLHVFENAATNPAVHAQQKEAIACATSNK